MMDWGTLDGDDSAAAPAARDEWGSLDGGRSTASSAPGYDGSRPRREAADEWGFLDGTRGTADGGELAAGPTLTPEATGSLLAAGEVLWVHTAPGRAELGSGQQISLRTRQTELFGWRQARIIEPATLTAELIEIPSAPLPAGAGDDPTQLYLPPTPAQQTEPSRAARFPVGAGPNLHQLLEQRIATAREQYQRFAEETAARANALVVQAERDARSVVEQERGRLGREMAAARSALQQAEARGNTLRTLVIAFGAIGVLLLLLAVVLSVRAVS